MRSKDLIALNRELSDAQNIDDIKLVLADVIEHLIFRQWDYEHEHGLKRSYEHD